ncbi:hypothetical protein GTV32_14580 [Gordonia sp. SID5947]|uniref:hypothetical protein n=1 Tax=Gordonia sp. SID5947 TaxID=2690315 RepID=UPI00136F5492|nr:hypothetical protein [Gordonia sp. SID5947]MYR07454.1 hypothetical protein [Gordonia sp. SID5947]
MSASEAQIRINVERAANITRARLDDDIDTIYAILDEAWSDSGVTAFSGIIDALTSALVEQLLYLSNGDIDATPRSIDFALLDMDLERPKQ